MVESKPVAVSCVKAVVPVHFHEPTTRSKREVKREFVAQLLFIKQHPNTRQAEAFKTQHAFSNRVARKMSKGYRRYLMDIEALKVYALNNPGKTSTKLKIASGLSLSVSAICNIRRRETERIGEVKDIADLIKKKLTTSLATTATKLWCLDCRARSFSSHKRRSSKVTGRSRVSFSRSHNSTCSMRCSKKASPTPSSTAL